MGERNEREKILEKGADRDAKLWDTVMTGEQKDQEYE